MSFDTRPSGHKFKYTWAQGRCEVILRCLSSVVGGVVDAPNSGGEAEADTRMELIINDRWQLLRRQWGDHQRSSSSSSSADRVVAEKYMTAPVHVVHSFALLKGSDGAGVKAQSPPCRTVTANLACLGDRLPEQGRRFVRAEVAKFLDDAVKNAVFLAHRTMRVAVAVELVTESPYDETSPLHQRMVRESMTYNRSAWGFFGGASSSSSMAPVPGPMIVVDAAGSPRMPLVCTICGDKVQDGSTVASLPCGHTFHMRCMWRWLGFPQG